MLNMVNKYKTEYIGRTKELNKLIAPVFLEQAFMVAMGMVTTILVSRVDSYALPAVSVVDGILNLVLAFFGALTIGATIIVAQYTGKGDREKASGVAAQAIVLSVGFGVIFCIVLAVFRNQVIDLLFGSAAEGVILDARLFMGISAFSLPAVAVMLCVLGVLRGSGNTHIPMAITMIVNIVNLVLGLVLIWNFGVAGAAFALLIARYVGAVLGLLYIIKRSLTIRFSGISSFRPNFSIQKMILGLGLPTSVESGTFQMGKLVITVFVAGMGTAAIASNAVIASVSGILFSLGTVFSTGTTILVGQRVGRGKIDDVKKTAYFTVAASMFALFIACVIIYVFMSPMLSLYEITDEMMAILRPVIIILCIVTPIFWSASFVGPAALRATGDVKYAMVVAIASMVFVRVALAYILGVLLGLGILGVWLSMYADWVVRAVFFMLRIKSGKWQGRAITNDS